MQPAETMQLKQHKSVNNILNSIELFKNLMTAGTEEFLKSVSPAL